MKDLHEQSKAERAGIPDPALARINRFESPILPFRSTEIKPKGKLADNVPLIPKPTERYWL